MRIDLRGQRFGRLVVEDYAEPNRHNQTCFVCRCDCGAMYTTSANVLRRGDSKSCGCLRRELGSLRGSSTATHGMHKTPEYRVWRGMINRCTNPNGKDYKRYGGRGIRVEWRTFEEFFASMGPRPTSGHSIERIDNNGNYGPGKCVWATQEVQVRNKSNTRMFTFNGKTLTISEWARHLGMTQIMLATRFRRGWSIERALTTPALR